MPTRSHLNLTRWLRRLGYKTGEQPETLFNLQPVQVVSDASSLTPILLSPTAGFGGRVDPSPGDRGACQIQSVSAGGTLITDIQVQAPCAWGIFSTPRTFAGVPAEVTPAPQPMTAEPVEAICIIGALIPGDNIDNNERPVFGQSQGGALEAVFIPSGQFFVVMARVGSTDLHCSMRVEEPPGEFAA